MLKSQHIFQVTYLLCIILCIIIVSCSSRVSPVIEVIPEESVFDQPVSIRILNCPENEPVKIRSTMFDDDSIQWVSVNTFMPDNGVVDLTSMSPTSGSYDTIDAMGFIWSMKSTDLDKPVLFSSKNLTPLEIQIEVFSNDSLVATSNLPRLRIKPDVYRTEVREAGLVGTLFVPRGAKNKPGIIDLTGSGGGMSETRAALLASHGYVTFALAYFGSESLPKTLTNIPLEYFEKAIQFLKRQKGVDPNRIGIIGSSRGGELSLLVGSTYSDIKCVVGYVPSIFRCPGAEGPAWTLKGKPLPFISVTGDMQILAEIKKKVASGKAVNFTPWFESVINNRDALRDTEIPVEKINGPILLISGQDDKIWPSAQLSEIAIQRLNANDFKYTVKHLTYPNAGHLIGPPFRPATTLEAVHPVNGVLMKLGGTAAGNAHACEDSWQQLLSFLKESFSSKK
jgi:dienelactone hydrolase